MFKFSNGETANRMILRFNGDEIGVFTKDEKGYHFKKSDYKENLVTRAFYTLTDNSTSEEIEKFFYANLTATRSRGSRHELFSPWVRTVDDELYDTKGIWADRRGQVLIFE